MGKEARYKKEVKEVEKYGALREEQLFLCHVHPSLFLLILTYGTSWAAPLGKNTSENAYMHVIIQLGLPEMTHFALLHTITHSHFL